MIRYINYFGIAAKKSVRGIAIESRIQHEQKALEDII